MSCADYAVMGVPQVVCPSQLPDLDQIAALCESGWYDTADSMLRMAHASESANPHVVQAAGVMAGGLLILGWGRLLGGWGWPAESWL